ncbi:hypothetical protein KOW79_009924 [Hemibagrus wyckioides]|uniref:Uncharacterized protein n=1 Tax=Hemibagrus wyckioides TaxID=337641 RepID=A0A9D3SP45_9TELE|nr:hypothetical protein KOW79_009924 [Hemibagrus wyckioides]
MIAHDDASSDTPSNVLSANSTQPCSASAESLLSVLTNEKSERRRNANAWIPRTNPLLLLSLVCGECTARAQPRNGVGEQERRKKSNPGRDIQGLRLKLKLE